MATVASRVRSGTFTVSVGSLEHTFSCQPTSVTVTPTAGDVSDAVEVLCGDSIAGDQADTTYALSLTAIQQFQATDTASTSLVLWALDHDGEVAEFDFKPNATAQTISGTFTVTAMPMGGDVGPDVPTSEAEWAMSGPPVVSTVAQFAELKQARADKGGLTPEDYKSYADKFKAERATAAAGTGKATRAKTPAETAS